jgi:PAS domain-containing protein
MNQLDGQQSLGVLDALDTGLIVLDGDARVAAWNAWLVSASGISAQDAVGKRLEDMFPGTLPASLTSAISDAQASGASRLLTHSLNPVLFPLWTRSRQELIHNVSVRPLGSAPHSRCLVQIVDVTMAVRREQVLRARQSARYDAVVNSAPDAILTLDAQGVIQLANPAAAQEFGYTPQELVGLDMAVLLNAPEP